MELLGLPGTRAAGHSEEHLTLETDRAGEIPVGSSFYGIRGTSARPSRSTTKRLS